MTIEQKISMALAYKGMSQAALAREIGTSPANLNQRMKRGSFTAEEMEKIADAVEHVREVYLSRGGRLHGKGVLPC